MITEEKLKTTVLLLLPLALMAALLILFFNFGPLETIKAWFPPVERISFERIEFEHERITVHIINDGPDETSISQILVNDAYNIFTIEPKNNLMPLEKATIKIDYPWVFAEPVKITILTNDGLTFEQEIGVPFVTPKITIELIKTFALIGFYVGVFPVFFGFLWLPFLRTLDNKWYHFFLSITIGLLLFLAVDAIAEAFELVDEVPSVFQGTGLILVSFVSSLLIMLIVGKTNENNTNKNQEKRLLGLAYMIAIAIGIHNFGEGLAIGGAYSIGEISLGTLLVVGFMIHNVTEGIAIVAPISRIFKEMRNIYMCIIHLGLIAGLPTIFGTWIGAFSYSPTISLIFFSIGGAAAFQVIIEVINHMKKEGEELISLTNATGVISGLLIMYLTGLLVF